MLSRRISKARLAQVVVVDVTLAATTPKVNHGIGERTTRTTITGMHDDKILQGYYTTPITRVQVFGSRRLACSEPRKPHNGLDSVSAVFGTAVQKTCRSANPNHVWACKGGWPEMANLYRKTPGCRTYWES